jgi:energy-coupling factor transporter ATP-binding protein EcfA2
VNVNRIHIKNFKSIVDLRLELAPVNVFIGENGSGKSNILEALAFAAAAAADKLDNEFLVSRGIRVTEPRFMRSAFAEVEDGAVWIDAEDDHGFRASFEINTSGEAAYPKWSSRRNMQIPGRRFAPSNDELASVIADKLSITDPVELEELAQLLSERTAKRARPDPVLSDDDRGALLSMLVSLLAKEFSSAPLADFIIYSPEITALRTFEKEGQILPLGVRGEGLLKLLRFMANEDRESWDALRHNLELLDWLSDIDIDHSSALLEQSLRLRDRFMAETSPPFDQRSANEGFLYLLFFFALILSKATPRFFAIENIDTSLNPKACSELMRRLTQLIVERQKQVLLTTHNPSILDGLNLHDEKQRLFVVYRNKHGHTVARRVTPPKPVGDELPIRLSEAFLRGLLGGIPQNF